MPDPTDVRVEQFLTNYFKSYKMLSHTFAADIVAPPVTVDEEKGHFKEFGMEAVDIHVSDIVPARAKINEIDFAVTDTTYTTKERGLGFFLSKRVQRNNALKLKLEMRGTRLLKHALKLREELRVAELAAATSNATAISPDWDDASATIIADIQGGIASFEANFGTEPTHILFRRGVAREIVGQATIVGYLQYAAALSQPMQILSQFTPNKLPPEIAGLIPIVPTCLYNSAQPGATRTMVSPWGDDAFLFYVDKDTESGAWARQFRHSDIYILKWEERNPNGTMYAAYWDTDVQETTTEAIWELTDVT